MINPGCGNPVVNLPRRLEAVVQQNQYTNILVSVQLKVKKSLISLDAVCILISENEFEVENIRVVAFVKKSGQVAKNFL